MKLLYAMHVNWQWIRQRPHVIADMLAARHDLRLLHFAMYRREHRVAEAAPSFDMHVLHRLPGRIMELGAPLASANAAWLAHQVGRHVHRQDPDLVWLTHPDLQPAGVGLDGRLVVYDCMDDHLAFRPQATPALAAAEARLVGRADLTLFSSATLARRVAERSPVRRALVVNNGVSDALCDEAARHRSEPGPAPVVLGYFGTVSRWFDWPLALRLLEALPQAHWRLAGPVETPIPAHPRIHALGPLPHEALAPFAAQCHLMLMPFVVDRLIEAVDPVKLYEYVALGRPALAPRYAESTRFAPLVHLYDDADDAVAQAQRLLTAGATTTPAPQRLRFLAAHRWSQRMDQIDAALATLRATGGATAWA